MPGRWARWKWAMRLPSFVLHAKAIAAIAAVARTAAGRPARGVPSVVRAGRARAGFGGLPIGLHGGAPGARRRCVVCAGVRESFTVTDVFASVGAAARTKLGLSAGRNRTAAPCSPRGAAVTR